MRLAQWRNFGARHGLLNSNFKWPKFGGAYNC